MMQRAVRMVFRLLVAVAVGIVVALAIDSYQNIAVEKKLRKGLESEIRSAVRSFVLNAKSPGPDEVIGFLKNFSAAGMQGRIVAVDPSRNDRPDARQFDYLFTFTEGSSRVDCYIVRRYLSEQLAILETPTLLFGLVTTIIVFSFATVYAEKRQQSLELRRHIEMSRAEFRKTIEEQEPLVLLGRMAATLAHELKTPVATISNLLQLLPDRLSDEKFTKRFVAMTAEELSRTQQLIDNLLAYGKDIDADHSEWVALEPFLAQLASKSRLKSASCARIDVYGVRFYLGLLFENLARNSRDAGAREISVCLEPEGGGDGAAVALLVEDDGAGFPTGADLETLVDPFVTLRSRGAGLGLHLANRIVASMGGRLSLYRMAKGAGIRISLPPERVRPHG